MFLLPSLLIAAGSVTWSVNSKLIISLPFLSDLISNNLLEGFMIKIVDLYINIIVAARYKLILSSWEDNSAWWTDFLSFQNQLLVMNWPHKLESDGVYPCN